MKDYLKNTTIIVLIVAIFLLMLKECAQRQIQNTSEIKTDILHIHDSIYFPAPKLIIKPNPDTIRITDTAFLIEDYLSEKTYTITHHDTVINATTEIKVEQNAVKSMELDYDVTRITQTITAPQKFAFSAGCGLSYCALTQKVGIELQTSAKFRRHEVTAGYDIINRTLRIGWQYQIFGR